jgi:hypothetical protein
VNAFAELRDFAYDTIPALLLAAGGRMDKQDMHARVRSLFIANHPWSEELDRLGGGGCTIGMNAVAWAMAWLVRDGILLPSSGRPWVELARHSVGPAKLPSPVAGYRRRAKRAY